MAPAVVLLVVDHVAQVVRDARPLRPQRRPRGRAQEDGGGECHSSARHCRHVNEETVSWPGRPTDQAWLTKPETTIARRQRLDPITCLFHMRSGDTLGQGCEVSTISEVFDKLTEMHITKTNGFLGKFRPPVSRSLSMILAPVAS